MNLSTPAKNEQWNWVTMYKIAPDILDDLCRLSRYLRSFAFSFVSSNTVICILFSLNVIDFYLETFSRFIVNVPEEERKDLVRLCFQIELAHWFYIDFYCSEENSSRKHCSFREFAANIFKVEILMQQFVLTNYSSYLPSIYHC